MTMDSFFGKFALARAARPVADFIAYYLTAFDPQELETKISNNWSLVDTVSSRPKEELLGVLDEVLEKYPDIKRIVQKSRERGAQTAKGSGNQFLTQLSAEHLVDLISERLPAQGEVLRDHIEWVQSEINRVGELIV